MLKTFSKLLLVYFGMTTGLLASSFEYDSEIECPHYRSRNGSPINTLVLHYTAGDTQRALHHFTGESGSEVSAHYMTDPEGLTYKIVDCNDSAFHAGLSYWNGNENINDNSIGIENVNFGYWREGLDQRYDLQGTNWSYACGNLWHCYPEPQINSIVSLAKFIIEKYKIKPRNVVGHSDIAPKRKQDPGPLFPWEKLALSGIGAWPDVEAPLYNIEKPSDLSVSWVQQNLDQYGYSVPLNGILDDETKNVVKAFQMHFDPSPQNFGEIDQALIDKLASLVDQHCYS